MLVVLDGNSSQALGSAFLEGEVALVAEGVTEGNNEQAQDFLLGGFGGSACKQLG